MTIDRWAGSKDPLGPTSECVFYSLKISVPIESVSIGLGKSINYSPSQTPFASLDHIQNQIQSATPTTLTSSTPLNASSKPRIWSLADLAAAPAPVPPQTQSATKSHLSTNPQLDACPPFPFTTQQMSVQTSNSNQQNHGHAAYFGRTGAGPGGPMMGPGGPGMHARPPLPGWPGLFPVRNWPYITSERSRLAYFKVECAPSHKTIASNF